MPAQFSRGLTSGTILYTPIEPVSVVSSAHISSEVVVTQTPPDAAISPIDVNTGLPVD